MESSLYRFVLKYAPRETAWVCVLTIASMPFYYMSLEVPKTIVNQALLQKNITFPVTLFGIPLERVTYLFVLCAVFAVLFITNTGVKQYINTLKGRLGERLLRRLRYELVSRVLRFPLPHFRKVSAGEIIPMVTSEVEPLGGFMGDAIAQPLIQGGTLLVIVVFLFMQNPWIGLAAVSLYPLQAYLIPKLQRRVNQLGKERVRNVRRLSDRIGEMIGGVQEVHGHGTQVWERADFTRRLGHIFKVRFEIYQRKSFVKFLNNMLNQMVPLLFYSIGGYLVIKGSLSVGALTAALAANKDMSSPWKELLDYYQQLQDSKIKYDQVTEQFKPENMFDEALQAPLDGPPPRLEGPIVAANVGLIEDTHAKLLEGASFKIEQGEKVALVGPPGGGKEAAAMLLARLYLPTSGKITIGDKDLAVMPSGVLGARIGYIGPSAYLFAASIGDNLTYGLRQRLVKPLRFDDDSAARQRERWLAEAARAGNLPLDPEADWIDWESVGLADGRTPVDAMIDALTTVDLQEELYHFGLRGTIRSKERPDIAEAILKARAALQARIKDPDLAPLVEVFDPEKYNNNATLAENLLFGTPVSPAFDVDRLAENAYVLGVLDKVGLTEKLVEIGREVATTMIELFADLPPGHEFFEQFSFISSEDLPEFQALLSRVEGRTTMSPADRARLLTLPFKLIEARHRLGLLDDKVKASVLEARRVFHEELPESAQNAIEFFDPNTYNAATTLQDNILFGKLAYGQARAAARVGKLIVEILDELKLRRAVLEVGLDFSVGIGGARLSQTQRQKLALARAIMKRPDILILNEATAAFDSGAQARVMENLFKVCAGSTVVWALHNAALAGSFDRVLVFADGRVAESGSLEQLKQPGTLFAELVAAA
jgi:ABC-type multidrug transport system fused ATPase/permease subunit